MTENRCESKLKEKSWEDYLIKGEDFWRVMYTKCNDWGESTEQVVEIFKDEQVLANWLKYPKDDRLYVEVERVTAYEYNDHTWEDEWDDEN